MFLQIQIHYAEDDDSSDEQAPEKGCVGWLTAGWEIVKGCAGRAMLRFRERLLALK